MSTTIAPVSPRVRAHRPRSHPEAVRTRPPAPAPRHGASPARHGRGGTVLFEVPFKSAMTDGDLALLARLLDVSTHMYAKQRPNPTSPGVARLDHFSGLYLERGPSEGEWVFEVRTWGHPAPESVHEWQLLATQAAQQLDPSVGTPERLPARSVEVAERPVGEVLGRRFAQSPRHLVGLP